MTQIINLSKLPTEIREFLLGLAGAREIRKYSERKIRKVQPDSLAKIGANPSLPDL